MTYYPTRENGGLPIRPKRVHSCLGNDPTCPGHDGDPCHYLPMPGSLAAELDKVRQALDDLAAEGHPLVRLWVWRLRRQLARTERTIARHRVKAIARYFKS